MTIGAWRAAVAASAALALVVAGCGSSSNDNTSSSSNKTGSAPAGSSAKKGGDLKVLYAADVDFMDPRATYYQYGFLVAYATQRPLYSYKPDDAKTPEPDLADGPPQISSDGKTVTVKIRSGVKFSPPVNREVTSKDVKYALESAFTKTVNGPYVGAYMGDVHGLQDFANYFGAAGCVPLSNSVEGTQSPREFVAEYAGMGNCCIGTPGSRRSGS